MPASMPILTYIARTALLSAFLGGAACQAETSSPALPAEPVQTLTVVRNVMGADVVTPAQTTAAVGTIDLLANNRNIEELVTYLDRLSNMTGVRNAIAWYANQVIVCADNKHKVHDYETALAIYQTIPSRREIIATQTLTLNRQYKTLRTLDAAADAAGVATLKALIKANETQLALIQESKDFDATLVMRRGRCFYHLKQDEAALLCFRTLRTKYPTSKDARLAAYGEIMIMDKIKKSAGLLDLCNTFLRAYPDSEYAEQVATLAGERLVQEGKWKEVRPFYQNLAVQFPRSVNLDRFLFYQALSAFMDADFATSTPLFEQFLKDFPKSYLYEHALYHVAMTHFLSNEEEKTKAAGAEYLTKYPMGLYAGDLQYRLSLIDTKDPKVDPAKIIKDLEKFVKEHPGDVSCASMLCLLGDTYKKKFEKSKEEADEDHALEAFKKALVKALQAKSPDDVKKYALDSATAIMQRRKDWNGIAELYGYFLRNTP